MRLLLMCLFINCCSLCYSQENHYRYSFNFNGRVNDNLFDSLEQDLGYGIEFNTTTLKYSYLQHLKNQNVYFNKLAQIELLKQSRIDENIHQLLIEIVCLFPTQSSGYYYLVRYYVDRNNIDGALLVLRRAIIDFSIELERFNYLKKLYSDKIKFIDGLNEIEKIANEKQSVEVKDIGLIATLDSIIKRDQMYRNVKAPNDPRYFKQIEFDSLNAKIFKKIVEDKGWVTKYLRLNYEMAHIPILHFNYNEQLFYLELIIDDCVSYNGKWTEAEQILWKLVNHTSTVNMEGVCYHSIPLLIFDDNSGILDLEKSMLAINSTAIALLSSKKDKPIWLVATSSHPTNHFIDNLEVIKKYLTILGYNGDNIFIQKEPLDNELENILLLKTPVIIKDTYGSN